MKNQLTNSNGREQKQKYFYFSLKFKLMKIFNVHIEVLWYTFQFEMEKLKKEYNFFIKFVVIKLKKKNASLCHVLKCQNEVKCFIFLKT